MEIGDDDGTTNTQTRHNQERIDFLHRWLDRCQPCKAFDHRGSPT